MITFSKTNILICLLIAVTTSESQTKKHGPKVGIVGAGIGGTTAAYFISQAIPDAKIDIFEMEKVGGRLDTVFSAEREYEIGGSVIHPANNLMNEFLNICGLEKVKESNEISGDIYSLHLNGEVIYQQSPNEVVDILQMIIRYGLWSLVDFYKLIISTMDNFEKIYPQLNDGAAFPTVETLLLAMSQEMLNMTKMSLRDKLEMIEVSPVLIDELVRVATRVNYGQFPGEMHALVGAVSIAGAQGGLWAVEGGNYKIPECLLSLSDANLHRTKVEEIQKLEEKFLLRFNNGTLEEDIFDIVIIAAPQTKDKPNVKFVGFEEILDFPGEYHRTVATIVHGIPNPQALGFKDNLTMTNSNFFLSPDNILSSLSMLTPVDYDPALDHSLPPVWKIFSSQILTEDQLDNIFTERYETVVRDWLAYPQYVPNQEATVLGGFVVSPGVYYTSDVEWAASAMEMSSLGARNVANLATQYWNQ